MTIQIEDEKGYYMLMDKESMYLDMKDNWTVDRYLRVFESGRYGHLPFEYIRSLYIVVTQNIVFKQSKWERHQPIRLEVVDGEDYYQWECKVNEENTDTNTNKERDFVTGKQEEFMNLFKHLMRISFDRTFNNKGVKDYGKFLNMQTDFENNVTFLNLELAEKYLGKDRIETFTEVLDGLEEYRDGCIKQDSVNEEEYRKVADTLKTRIINIYHRW